LSALLGLCGLYLVSEKKPIGFLVTASSVLFAVWVAIMAGQYGFLVANAVTFALSVRGYYRWK
jgi:nicotinamide riboside transporter PnuC